VPVVGYITVPTRLDNDAQTVGGAASKARLDERLRTMTSVTIAEIATLCGVKPRTVRKWIDSGELQAMRLDRQRVRVRSYDLEAMVVAAHSTDVAGREARTLIGRAFLQDDGGWRWTMFALWPILWIAAIITSVALGGLIH